MLTFTPFISSPGPEKPLAARTRSRARNGAGLRAVALVRPMTPFARRTAPSGQDRGPARHQRIGRMHWIGSRILLRPGGMNWSNLRSATTANGLLRSGGSLPICTAGSDTSGPQPAGCNRQYRRTPFRPFKASATMSRLEWLSRSPPGTLR